MEFLAAMAERRRIRRRDGALGWRLLRDLADPQPWIERYETPTWLDYRPNTRLTQTTQSFQRLRAFRGSEGPRVRRRSSVRRFVTGDNTPDSEELAEPLI
jgi:hypothetical protein